MPLMKQGIASWAAFYIQLHANKRSYLIVQCAQIKGTIFG